VHAELEMALGVLQRVLRRADPASTSGDEARGLVALFAQAERVGASGVALFAPVVHQSGAYVKGGHGSAPEWLAALAGSSAGAAKGRLAAAGRAAVDPALTQALHEGELSAPQLDLLTKSAAGALGSGAPLLDLLEKGASHQELGDAAATLRTAARSAESHRARRARVHAIRHFRAHQVETGGVRGEFFCDEVGWAKVAPLLEAEAKERWKRAGSGAGADSFAAHRLDAFLDLMAGAGMGGGGDGDGTAAGPGKASRRGRRGPRPHCVVIVNAESLRRGAVEGDEVCEIDGIGPVCLEAATELLGEAGVAFLVKDGVDIKTVTSTSREQPQRLVSALLVRDRTCCATGCAKRHGLVVDHNVEFSQGGLTNLANLAKLCPEHHDLKTYGGWQLKGEPGNWEWIAPAHPKSARYIAKARQLAAARAKATAARAGAKQAAVKAAQAKQAGAKAKRNHPRQD
jgi:hypothetical protein